MSSYQITNRMRRVFIVAPVPDPTKKDGMFPSISINPGTTESVPKEQWDSIRKHSGQIIEPLIDARLLMINNRKDYELRSDELQNPAPPTAPEDLDFTTPPDSPVQLQTKTSLAEVDLPPGYWTRRRRATFRQPS